MVHRFLFLRLYCLNHLTHSDSSSVINLKINPQYETLFQILGSIILRPPTALLLHTFSILGGCILFTIAAPSERNVLDRLLILRRIAFGSTNEDSQKVQNDDSTDLMGSNHPAYDNSLDCHIFILLVVISNQGRHSLVLILLEHSARPKYFIGKLAISIPS